MPDQVVFADHDSSATETVQEVFSGTKSYQDKLKTGVKVDGE